VIEVVTTATIGTGVLPTGAFGEARWTEDYSG
jgi:hypothetical protein